MGDSLEQRSLMRKKSSDVPKTGKGSLFLDKQKVESPIVQQLLDSNCEFRQNASAEHAQIRSLENNRKSARGSKVCNDDELVRHMSNLPGFLQKVEKEKSVQEKALNFGVLDWKQLEKWKYNERVPAKCHHKASSSSRGYVCMTTGPPKTVPYLRKQYSSNGLNPSVKSVGKYPIPYSRFSPPHKKPPTAHISSPSSTKRVRNETLWNEVYIYKDACPELNPVTSQANEVDIYKDPFPELNPVASAPSEGRCITHEKTTRPPFSVKDPKISEADIAEQPTMKGRHPSPTRWFSFGFGKMNRSYSFKEISTVPQLSSTYTTVKSGPVKEKLDRDKANASSRGRSSTLRRLLNPLLKYKASQSSKINLPPNRPLYSTTSGTAATKEPAQGREPEGVTSQGLLQLTLKNGLPFFKLVVENSSSDMLAAVVKRLQPNEKSNHCMIYAFYSVHETRKKSMTWTQGSKNKSCGLDYNIVGQMKISSFYVPKLHGKDSSHCAIRECVLYGVDREQDKQRPELLSDKEIAAVVLKSSCQNLNDGNLNDDKKQYQERGLPQCVLEATFDVGEDENSISTAVILPGGVHGNPSKGAASSLISGDLVDHVIVVGGMLVARYGFLLTMKKMA